MPDEQYEQFMIEVAKIHQRMTDHYGEDEKFKDEIRTKLNPMFEFFTNAKGWGSITLTLMKMFLIFAAVVGAVAAFITWLKGDR